MENSKKDIVQEYADEHCGGDRFRALYEINHRVMTSNGGVTIQDIITPEGYKSLPREEIVFLMDTFMLYFERERGGIKNAIRMSDLKETPEEIRNSKENPYLKNAGKYALILLGVVILLAIIISVIPTGHSSASFLGVATSCATAFLSTTIAGDLINAFRFSKAKKELDKLPPAENTPLTEATPPAEITTSADPEKNASIYPTFEECMEKYLNVKESTLTDEEADTLVRKAGRQNLITLAFFAAFIVLIFIAFGLASLGLFGKVIGLTLMLSAAVLPNIYMFKAVIKARDAVTDNYSDKRNTRQGLCALAAFGIVCLYFMALFAGVMGVFSV